MTKKFITWIATALLLGTCTPVPAQTLEIREIAGERFLVETGYIGNTKVQLTHALPTGGDAENFQSELRAAPQYAEEQQSKPADNDTAFEDPIEESIIPYAYATESEARVGLVYKANFYHFGELGQRLAWRTNLADEPYLIAQVGGETPDVFDPPDSFWDKLGDTIQQNPIKTGVMLIAGAILWDYLEDGDVDAFGYAEGGSGGESVSYSQPAGATPVLLRVTARDDGTVDVEVVD